MWCQPRSPSWAPQGRSFHAQCRECHQCEEPRNTCFSVRCWVGFGRTAFLMWVSEQPYRGDWDARLCVQRSPCMAFLDVLCQLCTIPTQQPQPRTSHPALTDCGCSRNCSRYRREATRGTFWYLRHWGPGTDGCSRCNTGLWRTRCVQCMVGPPALGSGVRLVASNMCTCAAIEQELVNEPHERCDIRGCNLT